PPPDDITTGSGPKAPGAFSIDPQLTFPSDRIILGYDHALSVDSSFSIDVMRSRVAGGTPSMESALSATARHRFAENVSPSAQLTYARPFFFYGLPADHAPRWH